MYNYYQFEKQRSRPKADLEKDNLHMASFKEHLLCAAGCFVPRLLSPRVDMTWQPFPNSSQDCRWMVVSPAMATFTVSRTSYVF